MSVIVRYQLVYTRIYHTSVVTGNKDLQLLICLVTLLAYYPHMPIGKVWYIVYYLFVCFCVFVRLRISPLRIKLAVLNFARWFISVLGRKSHILGNFAPPEAQKQTNRPARPCCNVMLLGFCDSHAY